MTLATKLLRMQLGLFKPFVAGCSIEVTRKGQDKLGELMARIHRSDVDYLPQKLEEIPGAWVLPKEEAGEGVILYLHGGGYVAGNLDYARGFATTLAAETHRRTFCIAYRLAPEFPFPAALEDAQKAYEHLLQEGYSARQIVLAGESAGGGLIYSLCLRLKELGMDMPAGLIAISPWSDMTASGASYEENKEVDPSLNVERLNYYADCYTADRTNPLVSPLFGNLEHLPPSLIFVGGDEILLDDAIQLHRKLLESGCKSLLTVKPEMWHAYILYNVKEAEEDYAAIHRFCAEVLE